jgi:hypothetical protein
VALVDGEVMSAIVQIHWPSMRVDILPPGSPVPRVGEEVTTLDLQPLSGGRRGVRRVMRRGIVASVVYLLERDEMLPTTEHRLWVQVTMRRCGR